MRQSHEELRDELMTLLLAGHETTTAALSVGTVLDSLSARGENKLAELEVARWSGCRSFARLPYLNAVCSETLRI